MIRLRSMSGRASTAERSGPRPWSDQAAAARWGRRPEQGHRCAPTRALRGGSVWRSEVAVSALSLQARWHPLVRRPSGRRAMRTASCDAGAENAASRAPALPDQGPPAWRSNLGFQEEAIADAAGRQVAGTDPPRSRWSPSPGWARSPRGPSGTITPGCRDARPGAVLNEDADVSAAFVVTLRFGLRAIDVEHSCRQRSASRFCR